MKRQRLALTAVSIAFLIASGLGIFAFLQRQKALEGEINALSTSSDALFTAGKEFDALAQGITATRLLKTAPWVDRLTRIRVADVARQAAYWVTEYNRLEGHGEWVVQAEFSPDGKILASVGGDRTVRLWQRNGRLIRILKGPMAKPWPRPATIARFACGASTARPKPP